MLIPVKSRRLRAGSARFAIVASQYNGRYVDAMLNAAKGELKRSRVRAIQVIRVPGAFEIPVIAARLARGGEVSAIICLGVILRGETVHAAHIGEGVSGALMQIQLKYEIPVVHDVLLLENEDQARARCLGRKHNRGAEAAQTALKMAKLMQRIRL